MATNPEHPMIEVAVQVNANSGTATDLVVFVDGRRVPPQRWEAVSYNSGEDTTTSLRNEAWAATREGSARFTGQVDRWYGFAETFARDDVAGVANQVQPGIRFAAELEPSLWFAASRPGTRTHKAARAAVAARVFHTCAWQSVRPKAVQIALTAYRKTIKQPANEGFDVLLRSLLTDLRHLAEAYKIRLESTPEPGLNMPAMAWDLVEVYDEIRNAARGSWAKALAATGRTAADVEQDAFRDFHRDCTTT